MTKGSPEPSSAAARCDAIRSLADRYGGVGWWTWDPGQRQLTLSPHAMRLLGSGPDTPHAWLDRCAPRERARVEAEVREGLDRGEPFAVAVRLSRPDDEASLLVVAGQRLAGGWVVGTVGRPIVPFEAVDRASEGEAAFAHAVSHDLRAPVRAVRAFGEILAEELGPELSEEHRSYLDHMVQGGERMACMVNALVRFVDDTTPTEPMERVRVSDVVDAAVGMHRAAIDEAACDLVVACGDVAAFGRPQALGLVFSHLIDNALRNATAALSRLEITAGRDDPWAVIRVRDHGAGLPAGAVQRAFLPFGRVEGRPDEDHAGMGLTVSRRLVEAMGGTIDVAPAAPGAVVEVRLVASGG